MLHVKLTRLLCSLVNLPGALMDLAASDVTWRHRPRTITRVCTAPIASITRTWAAITADNEDERKIFNLPPQDPNQPTNQPTLHPTNQSNPYTINPPTHMYIYTDHQPQLQPPPHSTINPQNELISRPYIDHHHHIHHNHLLSLVLTSIMTIIDLIILLT